MLILNEEKYAQDVFSGNNTKVKSVVAQIGYVTRYQLHVLGYDDDSNYKNTVKWANKYCKNFDESSYSNLVSDAVKKAHKHPFYYIDSLKITKSELDVIASLNDLRAEKVLFVLLCMAKQQSVSYGFTNGLVKYSITELCKTARISVPAEDREYILYRIVQSGALGYPKKNDTKCLIVNCINNDDEVVLDLNDVDCEELAYIYLNWKNGGKGYVRCELCGKIMKQSKKQHNRFCHECLEIVGDVPDDMKVIQCIDCGKMVHVSVLNTKTCRCEECQQETQRKLNKERQKRWYDNHKT
jgi:hypothetical protein